MSNMRSVVSPGVFGDLATTVIPPTPITGVAYRDETTTQDESRAGWPFATPVDSATFNQILFQVTTLLKLLDQRGMLGWCNTVNYPVDALAMGSDGMMYQALLANGPTTSVQDPVAAPLYWRQFGGRVASVAEAQGFADNTKTMTPLRLAEAFQGTNQSLGASGFQRLPGGLIVQWGIVADDGTTKTFPVAFPNACRAIVGTISQDVFDGGSSMNAFIVSASQFRLRNGTVPDGTSNFYIAIGN